MMLLLLLITVVTMATAQQAERLSDCLAIRDSTSNSGSGTYMIYPRGVEMQVWCDMDSNGGGWTYFQRRFDGSVDFYRNWASYEEGFGDANGGEYWLGNRNLHILTQSAPMELRIDMEAHDGSAYAEFSQFAVAGSSDDYRLSVSGHKSGSSTIGDSMDYHDNQKFTTFDRDNDERSNNNCARQRHGAWWYKNCDESNLNGRYYYTEANQGRGGGYTGMVYYSYKGWRYSYKSTSMGVRPRCSTTLDPHVLMSWSSVAAGTATFSCAAGYERASGDHIRACSNSGTWNGTRFTCQPLPSSTSTVPSPMSTSASIEAP